ncbi:Pre-mRNA-splicing factor-like protein [Hapsidospora chrysogenum ATCC 11550]|uniref:Pre-mRNA-splicing factor-like protein n=1 Tax=Hapsidospora chrysogenum (strain ATCC 11550 / CBS 779.69 / DSM 880 / IAM 14645 / JCM 23072 / IMI 49137) TaxID=857340 RepID=A0A086T3Q9_HAPC1|nr:Pre-mRNA-splicing factor-like protein [Hapsidospora chrysogenum ATCC 11550]
MLKSTYKPSTADPAQAAPLPPGWTEHKAPTGHTYYYNADTKESTYKRPGPPVPAPGSAPPTLPTYGHPPNLADPNVANAYLAQFRPQQQYHQPGHRGGFGRGGRGGYDGGRPKPQPTDKPVRKEPIPGCEPWILVYTKYSRRFVYNPAKNASYWRIPEKLMPGILELDKARIRGKAVEGAVNNDGEDQNKLEEKKVDGAAAKLDKHDRRDVEEDHGRNEADDSSEYEEVEVTDDEGDEDGHLSKRQRIEDDGPVEFTEADIAAQLQAMGEEYGLDPGEYDDGHPEDWPEGAEGVEFSEDDAKLLFKDLLNDYRINPYSPWEKLLEEGKVVDDPRYTALSTTKARRECWDEWSRERIAALREQRAKQEKKDPRIAYMAFLQEKATPKLYWPEFKRKYKKEAPMRDLALSDRDREKAYRDHVARLKLPQATRKADLTALLKAQPAHVLHSRSLADGLPTQVLVDGRYAALEAAVRDPLVEAYVQTLPPPPPSEDAAEAQAAEEAREKRERRERALEERNRAADEARRQREREIVRSKARLREGERELEVAMRVGNAGLRSQLEAERNKDGS